MESRGRAELSSPVFSTPNTLHNHGSGPGAPRRPRRSRPALESIGMGAGWTGAGAHERRSRLGSGHGPEVPRPWPPGTTASLWEVFSGLEESKCPISQRLAAAPELPTFHNYGLSIRTGNNGRAQAAQRSGSRTVPWSARPARRGAIRLDFPDSGTVFRPERWKSSIRYGKARMGPPDHPHRTPVTDRAGRADKPIGSDRRRSPESDSLQTPPGASHRCRGDSIVRPRAFVGRVTHPLSDEGPVRGFGKLGDCSRHRRLGGDPARVRFYGYYRSLRWRRRMMGQPLPATAIHDFRGWFPAPLVPARDPASRVEPPVHRQASPGDPELIRDVGLNPTSTLLRKSSPRLAWSAHTPPSPR
jgi:hypothetical protein